MTEYIKREDAKKWLTNLREDCGRYQDLWHYAEALDQIIDSLDTDVAPVRHGRWKKNKSYDRIIFCDECGEPFELCVSNERWNYCPNCGARMDGENDEID